METIPPQSGGSFGGRWLGVAAAAVAAAFVGCSKQPKPEEAPTREAQKARRVGSETETTEDRGGGERQPKRVILMIGDGMGTAAISGAAYTSERPLEMLSMEEMNYVTTHSYEYVTTDSAASATAYATGKKTHYEGLSVEPGTTKQQEEDPERHLKTLVEQAEDRGWKTGLVSTVKVVHATPAAFAAHRAHRKSYGAIARDLANSGVDVLLGGGRDYFADRADGTNLLEEMGEGGYQRATTKREFQQATEVADRLVGLFAKEDAPPVRSGKRSIGLAARTRGAISVLDRDNDRGFFLMVEGSQIDWRGHGLDGRGVVESTKHFDRAVGAALDYARDRDDTLVAVVSDHETGGLSILDGAQRGELREAIGGGDEIESRVSWPEDANAAEEAPPAMPAMDVPGREGATGKAVSVFGHLSTASRGRTEDAGEFWAIHTPEFVPMFAEGKGAEYLADAGDNAAVGRRLEELVRGERSTPVEETAEGAPSSRAERPKNAILFVGDGVGLDAWTATYYAEGPLAVRSMATQGLASTGGADRLVADDAAAGTALATGRRTKNGRTSVAGGSENSREVLETALEAAEKRGYRTGVVTTGRLTNPTVAAFYAHENGGRAAEDVASAFVDMPSRVGGADGIDVAYAGGSEAFGDGLLERLSSRGVDAGTAWNGGGDTGRQVLRLVAEGSMAPVAERTGDGPAAEQPGLVEMTRTAIERLKAWPKPFFLIVEAAGPGRLQRSADRSRAVIDAVAEFDDAVGAGLEFAERDGRTLVVATADADQTLSVFDTHYGFADGVCGIADRCGGPLELQTIDVAIDAIPEAEGFRDAALQGKYAPPQIALEYAWPVQVAAERGHPGVNSANFVPVFASGPWSGRLEGAVDQTQIGGLLREWARESL